MSAKHTPDRFELDHATDNGVRHFIIHGPLPKGISAAFGYPICDSMNRHHCISPEEDEANGQMVLRALNCHDDLLAAIKALYDQTADYIKLNNLGDVHRNQSMQMARDAIAKAEGSHQ